ncbi:MAG: SCO family protein [Phycisphaerales bacterium]
MSFALWAAPAPAQVIMKEPPAPLKDLDLIQKPGERIPLDLEFTDSSGRAVKLGQYFNQGKPVVLALVYYNCPMMCPLMLSRLQERLNGIPYALGEDFGVVVISFDPRNTPKMAAENKAAYLAGYNKNQAIADRGWTFHVSGPINARKLADAVGFPYRYVEETGEYAHGAALTVLTPDGRISGYLDGLGQDKGELRIALLQASEGRIAKTLADFFLHRCYRYDPASGSYTIQAFRVMQIGGFLTVMAVATMLAALRAGERARTMLRARGAGIPQPSGAGVPPAGPAFPHSSPAGRTA